MHQDPPRLRPRPRKLRSGNAAAHQRHRAASTGRQDAVRGAPAETARCGHVGRHQCEAKDREGISELIQNG